MPRSQRTHRLVMLFIRLSPVSVSRITLADPAGDPVRAARLCPPPSADPRPRFAPAFRSRPFFGRTPGRLPGHLPGKLPRSFSRLFSRCSPGVPLAYPWRSRRKKILLRVRSVPPPATHPPTSLTRDRGGSHFSATARPTPSAYGSAAHASRRDSSRTGSRGSTARAHTRASPRRATHDAPGPPGRAVRSGCTRGSSSRRGGSTRREAAPTWIVSWQIKSA